MDYIDQHKTRFGVEPICAALRAQGIAVAPSGYYAAKTPPTGDDLERPAYSWGRTICPTS